MTKSIPWVTSAILLSAMLLLAACGGTAADQRSTAPASPTSTSKTATEAPATEAPTDQPAPTDRQGELDLRYANVTEVEFEMLSENEYRFSVTLYHDDEGEAPNFADAWQVLDTQGNVLGERELLHSHGTQPFTRSETITIPEGVDTVLVRGHDMTHGFGGQAMRVDLDTGETTPVQLEEN